MFTSQYEEHLAHSAPCVSRFDGFDRGDTDWDYEEEQLARNEADDAELLAGECGGFAVVELSAPVQIMDADAHYWAYRDAHGLDDIAF